MYPRHKVNGGRGLGGGAMGSENIAIVGAGIGALSAAALLARRGYVVDVFERAGTAGGKLRQTFAGGPGVDAGPTVFTLKPIFETLFEAAGGDFEASLRPEPATVIARHFWDDGAGLDLFADPRASEAAIGDRFGRANAEGFRQFQAAAKRCYDVLQHSYIEGSRPSPLDLVRRIGPLRLGDLLATRPFTSLWKALGQFFPASELRQLFGRYATYVGASPFSAPATLMLIAHVEQLGVWTLPGGMISLAEELQRLAEGHGARFHFRAEVEEIAVNRGAVDHLVYCQEGERLRLSARRVVFGGDSAALAQAGLGAGVRRAAAPTAASHRSLSALVWTGLIRRSAFPLSHHTVFFGRDYRAEFDAIFKQGTLPEDPTVYLCAQDRTAEDQPTVAGTEDAFERVLCLTNAPALGDAGPLPPALLAESEARLRRTLKRCGVRDFDFDPNAMTLTSPREFHERFPHTGGALYGRASHGWLASFRRPGSRTAVPGLYLCGGSAHPGAGVPMATLSGMQAAEALCQDLTST